MDDFENALIALYEEDRNLAVETLAGAFIMIMTKWVANNPPADPDGEIEVQIEGLRKITIHRANPIQHQTAQRGEG